jgi:hypothetical protein
MFVFCGNPPWWLTTGVAMRLPARLGKQRDRSQDNETEDDVSLPHVCAVPRNDEQRERQEPGNRP